ncbi:MAG: hypothetical protein ACLRSW_17545 [Christensenellaceae bacterium]
MECGGKAYPLSKILPAAGHSVKYYAKGNPIAIIGLFSESCDMSFPRAD